MEPPNARSCDWQGILHNNTITVSSDSNISEPSGPSSASFLQDPIADAVSDVHRSSPYHDPTQDISKNSSSLAPEVEMDREDNRPGVPSRPSQDKSPTSGFNNGSPNLNEDHFGQASAQGSSVFPEGNGPNICMIQDRIAALEKKIQELESRDIKEDKDNEIEENVKEEEGNVEEEEGNIEEEANIENGEEIGQEWQEIDLEASPCKRIAAIPVLHRVGWAEFKNRYVEDKQVYAVDILVGNAKSYYQHGLEEKGRKKRQDDGHELRENKELTSGVIRDPSGIKEMPERIRINSLPILAILAEIFSEEPQRKSIVFRRPYKSLVYHKDEIKRKLKELEIEWGSKVAEANAVNHVDVLSQGEITSNPNPPIISADRADDTTATAASEHWVENAKEVAAKVSHSTESEIEGARKDEGRPNKLDAEAKTEHLTDSVEALRDMRCLVDFIDMELKPTIDRVKSETYRKIYFRDLWFLYKPGVYVLAPLKNKANNGTSNILHKRQDNEPAPSAQQGDSGRIQTVFRVLDTWLGRPVQKLGDNYSSYRQPERKSSIFWIRCYSIDFDGKKFGPHVKDFTIQPYDGEKDITSLDVYPMSYSPQGPEETREFLKERGARFRNLTAVKHQFYDGPTLVHHPNGASITGTPQPRQLEQAEGRVIIDFQKALSRAPSWIMPFDFCSELELDQWEMQEDFPISVWKDRNRRELDHTLEDFMYDDDFIDRALAENFILEDPFNKRFIKNGADDEIEGSELSDNELMLLPTRVFAYLFRIREFVLLDIDHLRGVRPNIHGWNDLKLPDGHKSMLQALVKTHFREQTLETVLHEDRPEIDVVQGKGRGLIILLHGAPGVGKTSTAECVAESNGKPLFPITCGDLGITAENVERSLAEKFDLAQRWGCILLLDEADVFLAARTKTDLKRNTLVSVFLRVLEYYTGILILTTNRVGAFDEAFKSRIHISLYYPPLTSAQTLSIWEMNLKRILARKRGAMTIKNQHELLEYANYHFQTNVDTGTTWNGRQIRNAFHIAAALAEFEAHEQNVKHRKHHTCADCPPVRPNLEVRHFKIVAGAALDFDLYIADTVGHDAAERAYMNAERSDAFRRRDISGTARKPKTENYQGSDSAHWSAPSGYIPLPLHQGKAPGLPTTSPSPAGPYSSDHYDPLDSARRQPGYRETNAGWAKESFPSAASKSSRTISKQLPHQERNSPWNSEPWQQEASRAIQSRPYLQHEEDEMLDTENQEDWEG